MTNEQKQQMVGDARAMMRFWAVRHGNPLTGQVVSANDVVSILAAALVELASKQKDPDEALLALHRTLDEEAEKLSKSLATGITPG